MTTTTDEERSKSTKTEVDHLERAAAHYKKAAHNFLEAAKKTAHGHDHEADHLIRHGSAHARHAHDHSEAASREHASDVGACMCTLHD
jgi:hypothetical protein